MGIGLIIHSDTVDPIDLGSSELVTIDQLVDSVEEIAGVQLKRRYLVDAPVGVMGRNRDSDSANIRKEMGWEPKISLRGAMRATYPWIRDQWSAAARDAIGG